ncbi:uncharacterized protein LOC132561047 [Ylistrum balloti]|uniref:uncharacterized protein LOC132561047 n=1 Tax=Ylistrum balloti TaxID=509963 RepID=UPI002905C5BB|nr:uncharacterized protein LOC132561047 [Ylistrum balloti]
MICGIVVVLMCAIPKLLLAELDHGDEILRTNSKIIMELQSRLSVIEYLHKQDTLRIADLERQQQTYQSHIAALENKREIDQSRINDLEKQRQTDRSRIADLENDQSRITVLEKRCLIDQIHITELQEQQRGYLDRIADLEKHRQNSHRLVSNPDNLTRNEKSPVEDRRQDNFTSSKLSASSLGTSKQGLKKRVNADYEDMVAFYAVLSHNYDQVFNDMDIRFDRVLTNFGSSYSGNTGVFTCTRAGVYMFSWTVHVTTRYSYTELVKNGAPIGHAFSGDSPYSGSGTGLIVLPLEHGDEISIRLGSHVPTTVYGAEATTNFSGFRLQSQ